MNFSRRSLWNASPIPGQARRLAGRVRRKLTPRPAPSAWQILFAFTENGKGQPKRGRDLYWNEPTFRAKVDGYSGLLEECLGFSTTVLFGADEPQHGSEESVHRNELVRLGLVQMGLFELWSESGGAPTGVISQGIGEVAAAYACGVLSREDAIEVLCGVAIALSHRSSRQTHFLLQSDARGARNLCRTAPAKLEFRGVASSSTALVVSATTDAAANRAHIKPWLRNEFEAQCTTQEQWRAQGRVLLERHCDSIRPRAARLPLYSATAGEFVTEELQFDESYWGWVCRGVFDFAGATQAAFKDGFNLIVSVPSGEREREWMQATARDGNHTVKFVDALSAPSPEHKAWAKAIKNVRALPLVSPKSRPPRLPAMAETFDLEHSEVARNPHPYFEDLRQQSPVHFLPKHNFWLVIGYDEVQAAMAQPEIFSNCTEEWLAVDALLLGADPPGHTAVRRAVGSLFSSEGLEAHGIFVAQAAQKLLEPLAKGQPLDVWHDFSAPLSEDVAAHVIGFDDSTVAAIRSATRSATDHHAMLLALDSIIAGAAGRLPLYEKLVNEGSEIFGPAESRSLIRLLWLAGVTTTRRALASSVLRLLLHPELKRQLLTEPPLMTTFVDECLRLHPPEFVVTRVATIDVEIGGVTIPAGGQVRLCLAAANRDPARFDNPNSFSLSRTPNRHLSFGGGIHRCLGATLARTSMGSALRVLLEQAPDFRSVHTLEKLRHTGFKDDLGELVIEC